MPKLIIKRSRELVNMAHDYIIYVNGKKKARVANGKKIELKLKAGSHTLQAKIDNYMSEPISLELSKGDASQLTVRSFKFSSLILPAILVVVPTYYFLKTQFHWPNLYGILAILPIAAYALYYHTFGKDKYLRWKI